MYRSMVLSRWLCHLDIIDLGQKRDGSRNGQDSINKNRQSKSLYSYDITDRIVKTSNDYSKMSLNTVRSQYKTYGENFQIRQLRFLQPKSLTMQT